MFRILGVLLALVLVFGLAFGNGAPKGNAWGFYGCQSTGDGYHETPGSLFQAIKARTGYNPAEISPLAGFDSVGEYLQNRCGVDNVGAP